MEPKTIEECTGEVQMNLSEALEEIYNPEQQKVESTMDDFIENYVLA